MAQFYTLEEAANRLAISPEDFKRRLKLEWTSIRPFRDGATLRFRAADIDELARSLGAASDPGLPLGPVGAPPAEEESSEFSLSTGHSDKGLNAKKPAEPAADAGESFSFAPPSDSGKGRAPKAKGDSDVRLDAKTPAPAAADPEAAIPTEEIDLDISAPSGTGPSSGKLSGKKSSGKLTGSGKIPSATNAPIENTDSSSEFELSLDSDSSDSFELQLTPDNSEEVDLGSLDGGPQSGKGGQSGINLGKPADSGVSLEQKGPKSGPIPAQDEGSEDDFELSLDPGASGSRLSAPKSGTKPPATDDSSSEFELTLDDDSGVAESLAASLESPSAEEHKGDIFETDFDLPALEDESGSEVVAADNADTDLEGGFEVDADQLEVTDDESASQVVLVDDEEAVVITDDEGEVVAVDELEQGESASGALRGLRAGGEEEPVGVRTVEVPAAPPKWGALPVAVLFPTLLVTFLGMLMSFEILRSMWGYSSGSKPGTPLVRGIADTLGMKVND